MGAGGQGGEGGQATKTKRICRRRRKVGSRQATHQAAFDTKEEEGLAVVVFCCTEKDSIL
jgi:hypothetical protein